MPTEIDVAAMAALQSQFVSRQPRALIFVERPPCSGPNETLHASKSTFAFGLFRDKVFHVRVKMLVIFFCLCFGFVISVKMNEKREKRVWERKVNKMFFLSNRKFRFGWEMFLSAVTKIDDEWLNEWMNERVLLDSNGCNEMEPEASAMSWSLPSSCRSNPLAEMARFFEPSPSSRSALRRVIGEMLAL